MIQATLITYDRPEQRGRHRRLANLAASLQHDEANASSVTILDLCETGCKILGESKVEPFSQIWIKLPNMVTIRAEAVWARDDQVGCEFLTPLSSTEVEVLAARTVLGSRKLFGPGMIRSKSR